MTLYCVKCDYKIESTTRDKICPKCGLPMFVYDEYLEDLKTAKEAEMESEKEVSTDEGIPGEEASTPIAEETVKSEEVSKEEETKETEMLRVEAGTGTLADCEEIISEGDDEEPADMVTEPVKKATIPTEKIADTGVDKNDESVMDWKEAMDWNGMDTAKDGTVPETETDEVDEEAEILLKKGNKKKYVVAAAGIAILAAGVVAAIKLLNKRND